MFARSFPLLLLAPILACNPEPADDDATADDDDSAAPTVRTAEGVLIDGAEIEVSAGTVSGTLFVRYSARDTGDPLCTQRIAFDGVASGGPGVAPGCTNCGGYIAIDPLTVLDVSDPSAQVDDCAPGFLGGEDSDLGLKLLRPVASGGYGDLLEWGLIDPATWQDTEFPVLTYDDGTSLTYDYLRGLATLAPFELMGALCADASEGTLASQIDDFDTFARREAPGSSWLGLGWLQRDPLLNAHPSFHPLDGHYTARFGWQFTLEP